ncbi:MAG: hypothetical protein GF398_12330 [Chitinivibrionales bacterium]|nr:hypothetical protein [Chitinivibrionales bacterium]
MHQKIAATKQNGVHHYRRVLPVFAVILFVNLLGCESPFSSSGSTSVTFSIVYDETLDFNLRVIEPYAVAGQGKWNNKYSKLITAKNGITTYTFDDVAPGDYAGLLGNISESYQEFSVARGQDVTLNYTKAYTEDICVTTRSGHYCVPQYQWSCRTTVD